MSFTPPGLAAFEAQQAAEKSAAAEKRGGGFFDTLVETAGNIGLGLLSFEAQKSILRDQVKITELEQQIATAEQRAGNAHAATTRVAAPSTFDQLKPWLIGGGLAVIALIAVRKFA